jgi:hypothetical protein
MNLRNGKITAVVKVTVSKEEKPLVQPQDEERVMDFIAELSAIFIEVRKYEESTLGRLCIYHQLYEFVDSNINEFKDVPRLAKMFATIRETCLRLVGEVGKSAMKHGKDPEYLEAIIDLSKVLLSVLAKLGNA